jgi:hypothetical protein
MDKLETVAQAKDYGKDFSICAGKAAALCAV